MTTVKITEGSPSVPALNGATSIKSKIKQPSNNSSVLGSTANYFFDDVDDLVAYLCTLKPELFTPAQMQHALFYIYGFYSISLARNALNGVDQYSDTLTYPSELFKPDFFVKKIGFGYADVLTKFKAGVYTKRAKTILQKDIFKLKSGNPICKEIKSFVDHVFMENFEPASDLAMLRQARVSTLFKLWDTNTYSTPISREQVIAYFEEEFGGNYDFYVPRV